ncbi:MAG TPA: transcription termination/antitermination protein NusG [Acidimicrobiia bacterium]
MADLAETTETVEVDEPAGEVDETAEETAEVEESAMGPEGDYDQALELEETPEEVEVRDTSDSMHVEENAEEVVDAVSEEVVDETDIAATTREVESPVEPATEEAEVADEAEAPDEGSEEEEPVVAPPASPYDMPGDWYVIHSYSGYENKVKANLETRIQSMHMEDRIFEVHIPMEDVVEFKGGKKVTVPKKVFPGYILVRMTLDDDSWYAVRNTPGVTGFVAGNAQKPTPLSRREVERFLGVQEEEDKGKPRFKPEWDVGEQVRVVTGPFADFNGVIEELNVDQQKVVVLVNIFGRDTPVELGFEDIQKS